MVTTCRRCLYTSDHPLGITFDETGLCSGCQVHEEKDRLDWDERWQELETLVKPFRTKGPTYDCIVPVSGARDSFFLADLVVNRLKMNPLMVSYNRYFNTPTGIGNLAQLRMHFDVDFQQKHVDPRTVRGITRHALYQFGNPYWHCLAGETVFPVQMAVMMGIPLIIWGAHQGLEQVGMFSHLENVEMTRRYRKDHDLFGVDAQDFAGPFDDLGEEDLINYRYPAFSDIEALGLVGIYLGNYVRWDPYAQHLSMVSQAGYRGRPLNRTFDCYDHADCYVYTGLHDVLKYFKHGYGKVTDQACREIRFGRMTRDQALRIVAHYEEQEPGHLDLFCKFLGTDPWSLRMVVNRHRNPKFFEEIAPNVWRRRRARPEGMTAEGILDYPGCDPAERDKDNRYITVGRGVDWPEQRCPDGQPRYF